MKHERTLLTTIVAFLMIMTVAISGCGSSDGKTSVGKNLTGNGQVKEFSITAKTFEFIPNEIIVNKGDHVILHIKSIDVMHGFAIAAYGINEQLNPGEEVKVEFMADKSGEFSFFCSVPCGSGHTGMQGKLIVK